MQAEKKIFSLATKIGSSYVSAPSDRCAFPKLGANL